MADHVLSSLRARIQHANLRGLSDGLTNIVVLDKAGKGKVPKKERFRVSLRLPRMNPLNLLPLDDGKKPVESSLEVWCVIFDAARPEDVDYKTPYVPGTPYSEKGHAHPHRPDPDKRILDHQTFDFDATEFKSPTVVLHVQSFHPFFEHARGAGSAKSIVRTFELKVG